MNLVKIVYEYNIAHDGVSARHFYDDDTSDVHFHTRHEWQELTENIKQQHAEVKVISASEELYST